MDSDKQQNDWDRWYEMNKHRIPDNLKGEIEKNIDTLQFLFSIYYKAMEQFTPVFREIMWKQFPIIKAEKRPMVVDFIEQFIKSVGSTMLFKLSALVNDQRKGVNMREKYPKFDSWVEFYGRPQKAKEVMDKDRPSFHKMNNEEWKIFKEKENTALKQHFEWAEKRKFEFLDALQTVLFTTYEAINELNADELIIYAVIIRDEYDYFLTVCQHIELFIDCDFPEEEIRLSDKEFDENFSKLDPQIKEKILQLRKRRIAGDEI